MGEGSMGYGGVLLKFYLKKAKLYSFAAWDVPFLPGLGRQAPPGLDPTTLN